ncbi:uncharacterized protein LOC144634089 [Oculina patagonica]
MSTGITEDQLKKMVQERGLPFAATELTIVREGGPNILDQGRIAESLAVLEHGEKIESLNKELKKKDGEIVALQKSLKELREKNDELNSALKSKDVEIETLRSRIDELEEDKRELQRKLGSVETDLGLLTREVEKLGKAKSTQDQTYLKLKQDLERVVRNIEAVKEDLEKKQKENDDLKKELKDLKESQHKGLLPLMLGAKGLPIKPPLPQIPQTSLEALLHLGEMCRQLQIKMYKSVFPNSFVENINYKVETIHRHLNKKLSNTEEAQKKWVKIQEKFHWSENHEEAINLLRETRNAEAHPEISKESLQLAISITDQANKSSGEAGWFTSQLLNELMHMWETDLS